MHYRDLLLTAIRGVTANKGRSMLTILGVIIGVAAIVLVMSLGAGAQDLIISQVQSVGGDTVIVRPGREPSSPTDAADTILSDSLKERDVVALSKASNVPGVTQVIPIVLVTGNVQYQDNFYHPTILGWDAQAVGDIFKIFPEHGDFFTQDDIKSHAPVAVIGSRVAEKLFDTDSALGKLIKLKNRSVRVVGVLPQRGQVSFFNLDELVIIPYTTAQQEILGINHYNELFIKIDDPQQAARVADDVRATLRETHNITDPAKDDFFVVTQQDIVQRLSTITTILTIFLSSIAAISLLVGGIGIMNIMLVSVTERTREIGLRKALGATTGDILRQFLLEAALLTTIGGLIGIAIAAAVAGLAALIIRSFALDWQFSLPLLSVILSIGMSGSIGLIFGLYPALKAANKSPIEALRWE